MGPILYAPAPAGFLRAALYDKFPLVAAKSQRADEDHAVDIPQGGKDGFARGGV